MKKFKLLAVILICVLLALTLVACGVHIEDINGDADFSLAVITDDEIINHSRSRFANFYSEKTKGNVTTIQCGKLSGITEIDIADGGQTIITEMSVLEGNCRLVLVKDGEIVYDFEINGSDRITLDDDGGFYHLRLAGESAMIEYLRYAIV